MKSLHNHFTPEPKVVAIKKFEFEENFDEDLGTPTSDEDHERIYIADEWAELEEDPRPVITQKVDSDGDDESLDTVDNPSMTDREKADSIIAKANREAEAILASANEVIEKIRDGAENEKQAAIEAARKAGYEAGFKEGEAAGEVHAKESYVEMMQDSTKAFLMELKGIIEEISNQKEQFAKRYYNELCGLAMSVAEKVIKVSLSSSGQVIERMIMTATEKCADKQWATVHISEYDEKILLQGDIDLLEAVKHISPNLKLEVKQGGELGTCIVEMPDQIIDASVSTQLENINEIIDEHEWNGEN